MINFKNIFNNNCLLIFLLLILLVYSLFNFNIIENAEFSEKKTKTSEKNVEKLQESLNRV